jgi:outer membrane protein
MKQRNNRVKNLCITLTLLLLMLIIATNTIVQGQTNLTFTEAINRVLNENPNLASAEASLEATRYNIAIARANYLPGIDVLGSVSQSKYATFSQTAGIIPSSSAVVGASLSQMIYNEKYLANFKIQKYLLASQEEQFRNTRSSIIAAAGVSYIGLLFAEDLLAVQQENILITEQNLQAARDRQEVGSTNMQEVLRRETQYYSDRQSIESQKAAVIIRRGSLNQLLNIPIESRVDVEKLTLENNGFIFSSKVVASTANNELKALIIRDYLVELGLANSPVLAGIDQQLLAQNRQLEANKRWAIPNFNFSASTDAKFDLNKEDDETMESDKGFWKVGVTMYWPLVDGGANINKVKQSRFQLSALELQKNDIKTSLEQSIRASIAVVISDFLNIGFAEAQADAAQKNYELVDDAYTAGESSLLDLLDAQNQLLGADISSRVALYTFFSDLLAVEQAIGYFHFMEPDENVQAIITELERRLLEN